VLLTTDGYAKLADFGMSILQQPERTRTVSLVGSPYWMAPEVVQGRVAVKYSGAYWGVAVSMAIAEAHWFVLIIFRVVVCTAPPPPSALHTHAAVRHLVSWRHGLGDGIWGAVPVRPRAAGGNLLHWCVLSV
jgi:serine/threonine protein kinase